MRKIAATLLAGLVLCAPLAVHAAPLSAAAPASAASIGVTGLTTPVHHYEPRYQRDRHYRHRDYGHRRHHRRHYRDRYYRDHYRGPKRHGRYRRYHQRPKVRIIDTPCQRRIVRFTREGKIVRIIRYCTGKRGYRRY
ncbi:MAG: hypothetical protein AAGD34_19540 [Pseudomonadota bacterium]